MRKKSSRKPLRPPKSPKSPPKSPPSPNLRSLLQSVGVSQRGLAKSLGIDPSYVSHVASGRKQPSLRRAVVMAGELGISLDTLNRALEREGK